MKRYPCTILLAASLVLVFGVEVMAVPSETMRACWPWARSRTTVRSAASIGDC